MSTPTPKPIYIFSHARVSSNLFVRLISQHPQLTIKTYAFDEAFMWGPERLVCRQTPQLAAARDSQSEENKAATYQMGFDNTMDFINETQAKGKTPVLKDHTYFLLDPNVAADEFQFEAQRPLALRPVIKTQLEKGTYKENPAAVCPVVLPPEFLITLNPIFLIRDPIRFVPSYYKVGVDSIGVRIGDADWPVNSSLRATRLLFDWYRDQGISPTVIDALDLVHDTDDTMKALSKKLNIDYEGIITNWSAKKPEHDSGQGDGWLASLSNSTGIDPSFEPKTSDLEEEYGKWVKKWGEEVGQGLKRSVEAAQEDYLYLRQNSILSGSS
ncbi:hypothetical protein H072_1415 [Dactylellina haptotyla CBS 200.50]|uniref:Sulfotransferase domain-containing protein n=1 Tax=Dactylellina haptotyla (strain CBS 200.50) TaxID=1284197 RepID=S8CA76_DACHA|nr:hypothetical protein H072_1415 [Dactylellina haptotyla CBS 200.50]